jgi:UDP-3-O-acyl-N-acetylglucosamine deacetylase
VTNARSNAFETHELLGAVGPLRGTGLFTGSACSITFHPTRSTPHENDGIVIERAKGRERMPASVDHVAGEATWLAPHQRPFARNTTLRSRTTPGLFAATIEHAMSALAGLGVWNTRVVIDGPEAPIFDGSASRFTEAIRLAIAPSEVAPRPILLTRRIEVQDDRGASITAEPITPDVLPAFTYQLDLGPSSPIPPHSATWEGSSTDYLTNVAPARTFSFEHEVRAAASQGLFTSFTTRDLLVVDPSGNPLDNSWRFSEPDGSSTEPARHKLLDLIGDLALLGRPLHARVVANRSGHALTHKFSRAVLDEIG